MHALAMRFTICGDHDAMNSVDPITDFSCEQAC